MLVYRLDCKDNPHLFRVLYHRTDIVNENVQCFLAVISLFKLVFLVYGTCLCSDYAHIQKRCETDMGQIAFSYFIKALRIRICEV